MACSMELPPKAPRFAGHCVPLSRPLHEISPSGTSQADPLVVTLPVTVTHKQKLQTLAIVYTRK